MFPVGAVAKTTLITGLIKNRNTHRAFQEYDALKAAGLQQDFSPTSSHLFSIMLLGAAWSRQLDRFAELLADVKQDRVVMNGHLANALVYAHGMAGDVDKAREVFEQALKKLDRVYGESEEGDESGRGGCEDDDDDDDMMEEEVMQMGQQAINNHRTLVEHLAWKRSNLVHLFNSMMVAYLQARQPAEAFELLHRMRERQVDPSGTIVDLSIVIMNFTPNNNNSL